MNLSTRRILTFPALLALAAGLTFAQPPAGHGPGGDHMAMLSQHLNLTADQQSQAKMLFEQMTTASAPIHEQIKALHADVLAAVKANDQAKLAQLAATQGSLTGQAEAVHLQTMAKFYALLTPAQQTQFETMIGHGMGMGAGMGMGHGPRQ